MFPFTEALIFIRPGIYHQEPSYWYVKSRHNVWTSGKGDLPDDYKPRKDVVVLLPSSLVSFRRIPNKGGRSRSKCRFHDEIDTYDNAYREHELMRDSSHTTLATVRKELLEIAHFEMSVRGLICRAIVPDILLVGEGKSMRCGDTIIVRKTRYSGLSCSSVHEEAITKKQTDRILSSGNKKQSVHPHVTWLTIWQWDLNRSCKSTENLNRIVHRLTSGVYYSAMFASASTLIGGVLAYFL